MLDLICWYFVEDFCICAYKRYWVHQINSRWIKDLNTNCDTIKVLEENISKKRKSQIFHAAIFSLLMSPTARDLKDRINKWDYIKIKSFFTATENISKIKREPTEWENIFANDTSDKGVISKIYKNSHDFTPGRQTIQLKNRQRTWKRHCSKEDIQRAHMHMKGCSTSLAIREIEIKSTMK